MFQTIVFQNSASLDQITVVAIEDEQLTCEMILQRAVSSSDEDNTSHPVSEGCTIM